MTEPDRVDQDAARGKEPEHGAGETDDARGLGGMSFLDHLDELRRRLFISVLSLVGGFSVCYPFSDVIFAFLSRPIHRYFPDGTQLAYTKLTEPFIVLLKVSAIAGVFLASPVIMLQLWFFISPGLYRDEKRYAIPFTFAATALFVGGGWFGYGIVFPYVCKFFLSVGQDYKMVVTMDQYFSLLAWSLLGLGFVFQLPLVALVLARFELVTARLLWEKAHYAIFGCFVASALITPTPDAVTMTVVALPMIVLYFVSIVIAWVVSPRSDSSADSEVPRP